MRSRPQTTTRTPAPARRAHRERAHRRHGDLDRRPLVVLELRHPASTCSRPGRASCRPDHVARRDEHDQRHVDGLAARRGRRVAVPAGQSAASPATVAGVVSASATAGTVTSPGGGVTESAAVPAARRAATAATAASAATATAAGLRARLGLQRLPERHGSLGDPAQRLELPVDDRRRPAAAACADRRRPTSTCTSTSSAARAGGRSPSRRARPPARTSRTMRRLAPIAGVSCPTAAAARTRSGSRSRADLAALAAAPARPRGTTLPPVAPTSCTDRLRRPAA
jgi:hypothetical protein